MPESNKLKMIGQFTHIVLKDQFYIKKGKFSYYLKNSELKYFRFVKFGYFSRNFDQILA